jgi:hypothetical protein
MLGQDRGGLSGYERVGLYTGEYENEGNQPLLKSLNCHWRGGQIVFARLNWENCEISQLEKFGGYFQTPRCGVDDANSSARASEKLQALFQPDKGHFNEGWRLRLPFHVPCS